MSGGAEFDRSGFIIKSTIKVTLFVTALFALAYSGKVGWDEFRIWAVHRKVNNLTTRAIGGICGADAACKSWMGDAQVGCVSHTIENRVEKLAPHLTLADTRHLKSCLQKSLAKFQCKGEGKCLDRITKRYDQCYVFAYPPQLKRVLPGAATNLTACLYGYQIVQGDQGGGSSMETVNVMKMSQEAKDALAEERKGDPNEGLEALKEELQRAGQERRENFDAATAMLNETRGSEEGLITTDGEASLDSIKQANDEAAAAEKAREGASEPQIESR